MIETGLRDSIKVILTRDRQAQPVYFASPLFKGEPKNIITKKVIVAFLVICRKVMNTNAVFSCHTDQSKSISDEALH